ncbi:MAG: hypothetical protein DUD39_08335 [Coriobacteriaceae bacterium]|nr:MAG: hypothetical protein DUD39_08335 [Coriobacteriaceae bacterium]
MPALLPPHPFHQLAKEDTHHLGDDHKHHLTLTKKIALKHTIQILHMQTDKDHIRYMIQTLVRALYALTAFHIREAHASYLCYVCWHEHMFWSSGQLIATTGEVSTETLKHLRAKADMIGRHLILRAEVPWVFAPQILYKLMAGIIVRTQRLTRRVESWSDWHW